MANFNFDPSFFMQAYENSKHRGFIQGESEKERTQRERLSEREWEEQYRRHTQILENQRLLQERGHTQEEKMENIGYGHQRGLMGLGLEQDLEKMLRAHGYDKDMFGLHAGLTREQNALARNLQAWGINVGSRDWERDPYTGEIIGMTNLSTGEHPKGGAYDWNVPPRNLPAQFAANAPEWGEKFYGGLMSGLVPGGRYFGGEFGKNLGYLTQGAFNMFGEELGSNEPLREVMQERKRTNYRPRSSFGY